MEPDFIEIKGASEHNLKNLTVSIPKKKFVVFTGVSGSGKSSLAFDILYAEGQRRYVESLSSYARQFLGQMPKPHYEYIRGLSPAISIEQKTASKNPRSTVGTVTEIYDYFRILYANIGRQHCPQCNKEVSKQTSENILNIIRQEFDNKVLIYSPIISNRKGEFKDFIKEFRSEGFRILRIDGNDFDLNEEIPTLNKKQKHNIELMIDRFNLNKINNSRLIEAIDLALAYGKESFRVEKDDKSKIKDFSKKFACIDCGVSFKKLTPQSFSFNSPIGMCEECNGLGYRMEIDPELLIPNDELSINDGAISAWGFTFNDNESWEGAIIAAIISKYKIPLTKPWNQLSAKHQNLILYGTRGEKVNVHYKSKHNKTGEWKYTTSYAGIINQLKRRYRETKSERAREYYSQYMREMNCPSCKGHRLKETYLHVKINNKSIVDITASTVAESLVFFKELTLTGNDKTIATEVLKEIIHRLEFLKNVGLEYLTLDRKAPTLSGGESQRIRLASQIGSELSGVMYILDEPSIGLHQRDNQKLLNSLKHLRDSGNSVIVIEHDEETMREADHLIDFGPGAGLEGGKIVAEGTPEKVMKNTKSLTGLYLSKKLQLHPDKHHRRKSSDYLEIYKARENNLNINKVKIPLNTFVAVTGVSGAGKSSLINGILVPALMKKLHNSIIHVGKHEKIIGFNHIDKLINIDQKPIGRSSRSNTATYTKVYDHIRDLYASLPESKTRGYKPGRFSFNVKGGRCEACQGAGSVIVEMHFLPDVEVECEVCAGKRFNDTTLEVLFKGKSIADILQMTVYECYEIFKDIPRISNILKTLIDVGMSYIPIGQPSTTLSGGEAQRIKLSRELCKRSTSNTFYVLDEPTTGLHFDDIKKLLKVLNKLVDMGNTVLVIEHNLDVIKNSDYVIDIGPEGGVNGGMLVASGTPEQLSKVKKSYTGAFLSKIL